MFRQHGIERLGARELSKNFKFNLPGLNTIMRSAEMCGVLNSLASQAAAAAGAGYEAETARALTFDGITSVYAATYAAKVDNSENNTLIRAVGSVHI